MKNWIFIILYFAFFAGTPLLLAYAQDVPMEHAIQQVILPLSLAGFGLLLGLFWLSRLLPRDVVKMKFSSTIRWHKYIGYAAGLFMLVHPVLMIVRRFVAVESNPWDNLQLLLTSPLMVTGIIAWFALIILILVAFFRKGIPAKIFRYLHGFLSIAFVIFSTWHVISIGRHSNTAMSVFWLILAVGAVGSLLISYLPNTNSETTSGAIHESA